MLAAIDWGLISGVSIAIVVVGGGVLGLLRWANHNIARPLRAVTGSPPSPGVEPIPSMLDRIRENTDATTAVAESLRENTDMTRDIKTAVDSLTRDHTALVDRVATVETVVAEVRGKIDGHLSGHS